MPVNINNLVPRMFHGFEIDTSNWPEYHEFLSNLSTIPAEWTREQWLRIICRTPEIKTREYDKYLLYRRKLIQFEIFPRILNEKYQRAQTAHTLIIEDLDRKGFFTTSESVFFASSIEQLIIDLKLFEEGSTRTSSEINTLEKKQKLFLVILANLFDAVKNGYCVEQTDIYMFTLIFNTFYEKVFSNAPETKGENDDLNGEFIMYYLFKKIFFDTKLYSFIQLGMKYTLSSNIREKINLPSDDDIKRYQFDISEMVSPHNIIPYLSAIIFIKLNNSSKFKKLSKQNRNVYFNSIFTLLSGQSKYASRTTGNALMIDSSLSDKYDFFANFFINGEDVLYLLCLFIYPWRYIKEQHLLKYILPSIDKQLSRHNNLRNKYDFKKTYKIGSSAEIIIQSPDSGRGETNVPAVRKFLAWALKNKVTKVPTPETYRQGLNPGGPFSETIDAAERDMRAKGITVNLSNLNGLYKYFTAPRENGKFNYINFFISFLKKNWISDISVPGIQGHTICPPLKYLGKFKSENESYKITPFPNAGDGDGGTKTGGGRIKNKYTVKYRRKSKRKTLKL